MTICRRLRRAWHKTLKERLETSTVAMMGAAIGAVTAFRLAPGDNKEKIKIAILAAVISGVSAFLVYFCLNLLRSSDLPDKERRLNYAKRKRITDHLAKHSSLAGQPFGDHILTISYDEGAKDAELLGADIKDAMKEARWFVDDEFVGPDRYHSEGLWLYGQGAFVGNPPECDLLQDAFRMAGLKLRFDREYRIGGTHIAIGKAPDKCFSGNELGVSK